MTNPIHVPDALATAFVGRYQTPIPGRILTVTRGANGALFAQMTGQSEPQQLFPAEVWVDGAKFDLQDEPGVTFTFRREASGWIADFDMYGQVYRGTKTE
jgi:hypothetical protein